MVGHSTSTATIKFLCSYGGKILPRYPDGKLRYHGGHTRVLSVDRSISFAELMVKLGELCDASVSLRCQLPSEDLDALVSITSDEDLANLIEVYDNASTATATTDSSSSSLKIRAFLWPQKLVTKLSPPPSTSSPTSSLSSSPFSSVAYSGSSFSSNSKSLRCPAPVANRCYRSRFPASFHPVCYGRNSPPNGYYVINSNSAVGGGGHGYLVHNGNHWQ